jgi:CRISPR-associated endoribonuclease Cas6
VLEQVEREKLHLTASALTVRMDSPIAVHVTLPDGKTRPVNPLEEDFSRLVNENYHRKWSVIAGAPPEDDITLTARSVGMQDKVVTSVKGIWVTAWGGTYRLTGTPQALEFLYHTGLGSRNSMGFGLFNILP